MKRFVVRDLPLIGLKLIERQSLGDIRGFFSRLFCAEELTVAGWKNPVAQINHSITIHHGTVRGMHYQTPPYSEIKLVSCLRGEVWDVAVDVRFNSPTFLHWHAEYLTPENGRALLIPEGFAHGFQSISDNTELLYCHSAVYCPEFEAGLNPQDERLAITWPLPIAEISARDAAHPFIDTYFKGVCF